MSQAKPAANKISTWFNEVDLCIILEMCIASQDQPDIKVLYVSVADSGSTG